MNIDGGFLNIGGFFEYWRGGFGQSHFFKNMGGFLNIEGGFLNIGGFLDNLIFSKIFFIFLSRRLNKAPKWPQECPRWLQSPQMASGASKVAEKCPFLVPSRAVYPASVKKAISGQILSLHGYRCWPTRLCYPNGPGLGGVWITRAPMYLQGLHTQPVNTKGKTNPFISWL